MTGNTRFDAQTLLKAGHVSTIVLQLRMTTLAKHILNTSESEKSFQHHLE